MSILDILPIEIITLIAEHDNLMLTYKRFTITVDNSKKYDFMIHFGFSIRITNHYTEWLLNNKLHRTDGPAIEYANGDKEWYFNNKRHRVDGPAVEFIDGYKSWWIHNKRHRVDGPAIISIQWWLQGIQFTDGSFIKTNYKK